MKNSEGNQFNEDQEDIARYEASWLLRTPEAIRMRSKLIQCGCAERISKGRWIVKSTHGTMVAIVEGKLASSQYHHRWLRIEGRKRLTRAIYRTQARRLYRIMVQCPDKLLYVGGHFHLKKSIADALWQDGFDAIPF